MGIEWNEIMKTLGTFGISASLITVVLGFLGKKYLELQASKKLEEAKSELLKQSENYKIKAVKLHEARVEVIKNIYAQLSALSDSVFLLVIAGSGDSSENKKIEEFYNQYYSLRFEFNKNKIFFSEELSSSLNELIKKIHSSLFNFKCVIERSESIVNQSTIKEIEYNNKERRDHWDLAAKIIEKEVPSLMEALESEFRKVLGAT